MWEEFCWLVCIVSLPYSVWDSGKAFAVGRLKVQTLVLVPNRCGKSFVGWFFIVSLP